MISVFSVGPIATEQSSFYFCVASDQGGLIDMADGEGRAVALRKLLKRVRTRDVACDPSLEEEAKAEGLRVAPLPDELLSLRAAMAVGLHHGPSFANDDRVRLVLELISAAVRLEEAAPWEDFDDSMSLDIRITGAEHGSFEGCVLGAAGEEYGLALYFQKGSVVEVARLGGAARIDEVLAIPALSLLLDDEPAHVAEAVGDLTGVAVAPTVLRVRRGEVLPPSSDELASLVAAAHAVADLVESGGDVGRGKCQGKRTVEARVSVRGEAEVASAPAPDLSRWQNVSRNDPCPCGSGKKYKKCHLGLAPPELASEAPYTPGMGRSRPGASRWHRLDDELRLRILTHARDTGHFEALKGAAKALHGDCEPRGELLTSWMIYEYPVVDGRSIAEVFLQKRADSLDPDLRRLLDAQLRARVSIAEVLRTEPGRGFELYDFFTRERRFVHETSASRDVAPREGLAVRVLTVGDEHLLAGLHPMPLPPDQVDEVLASLGVRNAPPPARDIVARWDAAVGALALKAASPNVVTNTDGDPVVFIEEKLSIKKGHRNELIDLLAGLEGAELTRDTAKEAELVFVRPGNAMYASWESTVVGSAVAKGASLTLTTNSEARADALLRRINDVAGALLTSKGRSRTNPPESRGGQTLTIDMQGGTVLTGNGTGALIEKLERAWIDEPIQALDGATPRESVGTEEGRWRVHRLLCSMEYGQARADRSGAAPVNHRRRLGLDELGEPLPHHELDLALGAGRKLSECLLEVAAPVLEGLKNKDLGEARSALLFAAAVWNALVLDAENGGGGEIARLRGKLVREGAGTTRFDAMVSLWRREHGSDRRRVGDVQVQSKPGGFDVRTEAHVEPDLAERARAAGIVPGGTPVR